MISIRKLTKAEKERLWEEVKKEFPNNETMQEIYYVRLMHYLQTKGLSPKERIQFFGNSKVQRKSQNRSKM